MTYSPATFILPAPRLPGGTVYTEVTWHPRDGESYGVLGAYAAPAEGRISLILGAVPIAVADLGLPRLPEVHADRLAELVDRQLAEQPRAELRCPAGRATLVLHPRRG